MRTIRTAIAAILLGGLASTAYAQEPAHSWRGFYLGAHGGYAWNAFKNGEDSSADVDINGAIGGIHGGHLWQWQKLVAGMEGDFSFANAHWDGSAYAGGGVGDATIKLDWLASLRGRVGLDVGPALLYATAGIAWNDWSMRAQLIDRFGNTGTLTAGAPALGWVVGGGAEVLLTRSIIARVEGLHYLFDNIPTDIKINGTRVPEFDGRVDQAVTVLRGGLSWRF